MLRDQRVWLTDIVTACDRVSQYVGGMDQGAFRADTKTVDAVIRNLEVIGEAAKQLSDSTRALAPEIEWRRIAGLRDVLIHAYFGVDDAILWSVVETKVPVLRDAAERLLSQLTPV